MPAIIPAELPPIRALRAVRTQLEKLAEIKPLNATEGEPKEDAWRQVTDSVLHKSFASNSRVLNAFGRARTKGTYNMMGVSYAQQQSNFRARLQAYEDALNMAVADLELSLPEEPEGVYSQNDPFAFYNDLRDILNRATRDVFIVDAYTDRTIFELYLSRLDRSIGLRVLCKNPSPTTLDIAKLFAASHPNFRMSTSTLLHDRVIFVDDRCWVIGQSLKDAAFEKPTYMVEISNAELKRLYEPLWAAAHTIICSRQRT